MPVSSLPPYCFIFPRDVLETTEKTNWAKIRLDPKPVYNHHTKPRQLIGRVFRRFVKDSCGRDEDRNRKSKSGKCSWCGRRFYDRREFFEHGICRESDDGESPTMEQARIWILETEEEINQLERGARAAPRALLAQFLRRYATQKHDELKRLLRAREELKTDVRKFKKQGSRGLVKQCEKEFLSKYAPTPLRVGGKVRSQTSLRRDRYLGWAVRGVEDGASRLMGKRCRIPYIHH